MAKDNKKSLDARIAEVLSANGEASRDKLLALWHEAWDAIKTAEAVIEEETPRLMDLSNDTPDQSRELIESSRLRIERMKIAIRAIKPRVEAIDQQAAVEAWTAEATVLRKQSDELYHELRKFYPPIVALLDDLFIKIRANAAAFNDLARRAPQGISDTSFLPAFPYESFWLKLLLPDWDNPHIIHPPRNSAPTDWEIRAANSLALSEQAKMLSMKVITDEDKAEIAREKLRLSKT